MSPAKERVEEESKRIAKAAWRALRHIAQETVEELLAWEPSKAVKPEPHDLCLGAQPQPNGWTLFAFFAPGKKSLKLAGNFNEWQPQPMEPLDEGLWWVALQLPAGRHQYQFVVEDDLWLCDPYAREVDWDEKGPKAVVRVGEDPYRWGDGDFQPRPLADLIIYELHVGDFAPEGTFEGVRQRLDYIQALGVTAIELMPIVEFPMDRSWGYNPAFFMAPEHAYGTPNELKRLIDEAHQRGIAVILDMVFNHVQQDNPLNQMWNYTENPYFEGDNPWGMPDFNHFSPYTKAYIRDIQDHWLHEYHVDGFRYDATAYIESDAMNGIGFFTWAARQSKPAVYLISEHLPQDPWWVHNSEMDAQWHDTFHDAMKAQLREGPFEGGYEWGDLEAVERSLFYALDGYGHPREVINYTASHDEQRIIHEAKSNPYLNDEIAERKGKLGMVAVITAAGVPLLYAGEEIGMDQPRSTEHVPFEWARLEDEARAQALHGHWQRLTWLRNTHPALRAPGYETLAKYGEEKAIAFQRWDDAGDVVVVLLNFSNSPFTLTLPFPMPGTWHEYLYDYTVEVGEDKQAPIEIGPSDAAIFCLQKNW